MKLNGFSGSTIFTDFKCVIDIDGFPDSVEFILDVFAPWGLVVKKASLLVDLSNPDIHKIVLGEEEKLGFVKLIMREVNDSVSD